MESILNFEDKLNSLQRVIGLLLLPVLYYLGAKFAIEYTVMPEGTAILWPPNSVLLAAFLLLEKRDLPFLVVLAVGAEIAGDMPSFTWFEALCFGLGNVTEAAIAYALLKHWRFDRSFTTLNDVLKFIVAALIIAALSGALIGATLYSHFRTLETTYLEQVRILWFGDALGLMIFTPLWLSLWPFGNKNDPKADARPYDYATGLAAIVILGVFISSRDGQMWGVHIGPTLLLPFVIYVGAKFGSRWASMATAVVALITIIMMVKGHNPFGKLPSREAVIQAQEFIFIMSLVALGSAALLSQLRVKQSELVAANFSLGQLNRSLETRVSERTRELLQTNLQLEQEMREREQAERALQQANQELQRLAEVDGLTQIANRRTFDAQLTSEWKRLSREGSPLSLILFDIDYFKRYNDFYGHQAGDACLIQIAAATSAALKRPADLVARYGGEEFAAILPETDQAGAVAVAQQICAAIKRQAIVHERSEVSDIVTISAGIATFAPNIQEKPELLVQLADQALYRAKAQGRDCYGT